jgi:hypothetical protein
LRDTLAGQMHYTYFPVALVPVHSLETPVCAYAAIDMVAN